MANPKRREQIVGDYAPRSMMASERSWGRSHSGYIAGRAYVDGADQTAAEMEVKWGVDRLRLLVDPNLRERFDRQRYLFNQAIWHGELEAVRREAGRMVTAWLALDQAATAAGKQPLAPHVWEVAVVDGDDPGKAAFVAAIVQDDPTAHCVVREGRHTAVYTLEEIARLLAAYPDIAKAKEVFPGATVTAVRRSVSDPLQSIHDTAEPLDDAIPEWA
jgi:hypothetical protein